MVNILPSLLRKHASTILASLLLVSIALGFVGLKTAHAATVPGAIPGKHATPAGVDTCTGTVYTFPVLQWGTNQFVMTNGDCVVASNGNTILAFQNDGNLVVYTSNFTPLWATSTEGRGGIEMLMQSDGNFVMYNSNGNPLWSSRTNGNTNAWLYVQNDGNVVIYSTSGPALWATGTVHN